MWNHCIMDASSLSASTGPQILTVNLLLERETYVLISPSRRWGQASLIKTGKSVKYNLSIMVSLNQLPTNNLEIVFQTRLRSRILLYCNTCHKDHSLPVLLVLASPEWNKELVVRRGKMVKTLVFSPCTVWGNGCLATWATGFVDLQVDQHRWWHWCTSLYSCRRKAEVEKHVHCYKQPTLQTGIKLVNQ